MPTYQIVTPGGVMTRPCPEVAPEPGQVYIFNRPVGTKAHYTYFTGQGLTLLERTKEAPYGYASSLGNWKVQCPYTISVWSEIEAMIADGTLTLSAPSEDADAGATPCAIEEPSEQWAKAITSWIDKQGGDGPSLWQWSGICPTPEQITDYLDHLLEIRLEIAANEELDACCETIRRKGWFADPAFRINELIRERRPSPTLKEQALKDLATVRQCSDILPEILDTIELALNSIPDPKGGG